MRRVLIVGSVSVVMAALVAGTVWAKASHPSVGPAGAQLIVDGEGSRRAQPALPRDEDDPRVRLDDLQLPEMRVVGAGEDDFALSIGHDFGPAFLRATVSGDVVDAGSFTMYSHTGAFDMAPDGRYAASLGVTVSEVTADWDSGPKDVEARRAVGAVDVDMDGSLLVGGAAGPTIDSITVDGTIRRLLAPAADPGAEVVADKRLGPIVALHRLPDLRVVFVSDTAGGFRLHVIDRGRVRRVEAEDGSNPVRFTGPPPVHRDGTGGVDSVDYPDGGPHLPVMAPLAPGPGGRVITIGLGREDVPEISLVDVDSGEIVLLARLEGVEPSDAEPVSAAAVGDDLVFTAAGGLWRLEGAFAGLT